MWPLRKQPAPPPAPRLERITTIEELEKFARSCWMLHAECGSEGWRVVAWPEISQSVNAKGATLLEAVDLAARRIAALQSIGR